MISEPDPATQKKWYGAKNSFTTTVNYFYQNNSIQKAVFLKEKLDLSIKQLSIKQELLHSQSTIRNNAQAKRRMQEKWEDLLKSELAHYKEIEAIRISAAITIQRHVRGFLARIYTEEDYILLYDKKAVQLIKDASLQALTIMLNLGVILVPATIVIQKAYRRYLIRKKLYRLRLYFDKHVNIKLEISCKLIQKGMQMIFNINKIKYLKFLNLRERKLFEIKRRLAILTIKEFWKAKKFSFKLIKEKIQRIKRRQAAIQNKEAYTKYFSSLVGKYDKKQTAKLSIGSEDDRRSGSDSPVRQDDNNPDLLDEEEYLEAQRMKELIQKKIQDKINKSKVSHAIIETKQVMILPLMQEKALKESPSDEISKLMDLTTSVFAKGRSLSRDIKKPSRSTLIGSPAYYEHKKLYQKFPLPHMRALYTPEPILREISPQKNVDYADFMAKTISSARKKYHSERVKPRIDFHSIPVSSNLIIPTISYTMKQKQKKILEKQKNLSFTSGKEKYTPSLNNFSYTPVAWKPIPLNKNILITTDYGKIMHKERSRYQYNMVNFSNRMLTPDLPSLHRPYASETPTLE